MKEGFITDPDAVARAYVDTLEYRAVERGQVSESVASTWATPSGSERTRLAPKPNGRPPPMPTSSSVTQRSRSAGGRASVAASCLAPIFDSSGPSLPPSPSITWHPTQ